MRRLAVLPLAGMLALAGCGETKIDGGGAEDLLRGTQTDEGQVVSARCPDDVVAKAGATLDCDVKLANGDTGTWTLHVRNEEGVVAASLDDLDAGPEPKPPSDRDVGKSFTQRAPGGGRVKLTLARYEHAVDQPSGSAILRHVVGIVLRVENTGTATVRAKRPTYYAVLHAPSGAGANEVPGATGPCGGAFYRER